MGKSKQVVVVKKGYVSTINQIVQYGLPPFLVVILALAAVAMVTGYSFRDAVEIFKKQLMTNAENATSPNIIITGIENQEEILESTPSLLGVEDNHAVVLNQNDTNTELIVAWENARLIASDSLSVNIKVLELTDDLMVLSSEASAEYSPNIAWQIASKRSALEGAAFFFARQYANNPETAQYLFTRGRMQQVKYYADSQSILVILEIDLTEE